MAIEIERKFLISHDGWKQHVKGEGMPIVQGYLAADEDGQEVRVRVKGDKAFITLKRKTKIAHARSEFEYAIPMEDAKEILANFRTHKVEKTRYEVAGPDGKLWEVDVFSGKLSGLVMAEIELKSADETFQKPHWVGAEVTSDKRYANRNLAVADGVPQARSVGKS